MLAAFSCNRNLGPGVVKTIIFSIEAYQELDDAGLPQSKTSIQNSNVFVWAEGDTVGIYPDTGGQVYFAMIPGEGATSAKFDGGGWDLKPSSSYYSYYPFISDVYLNRNHIPVRYVGQKQTGTGGVDHIGKFDYMYTPPASAESGEVHFSYKHLSCIIRPRLTLPAGTYTKLAVTAPTAVFGKTGWFDLMASTPAIVPADMSKQIQIDLEGVTLAEETTFQVYMLSNPVDLTGVEITVSVLNTNNVELQCKKTPSGAYTPAKIGGLTCASWTEVPASEGLIEEGWSAGEHENVIYNPNPVID